MNNCLWDIAKEFVDHDNFVILRNTVQSFLNYMATELVHAQGHRITSNCVGNCNGMLLGPVLKATLDEEVSKSIDHQRVRLADDSIDDIKFVLRWTTFELVLQKDGRLLIVVANDLLHNVFPITGDILVQETSEVERL